MHLGQHLRLRQHLGLWQFLSHNNLGLHIVASLDRLWRRRGGEHRWR